MSNPSGYGDLALGAPLATPLIRKDEHPDFFPAQAPLLQSTTVSTVADVPNLTSEPAAAAATTTMTTTDIKTTTTEIISVDASSSFLDRTSLATNGHGVDGPLSSVTTNLQPSSGHSTADHIEHQALATENTDEAAVPSLTWNLHPSAGSIAADHVEHQVEHTDPEPAPSLLTRLAPSALLPSFASASSTDQISLDQKLALKPDGHSSSIKTNSSRDTDSSWVPSLTTHLAPSSSPLAFDSIEHQAETTGPVSSEDARLIPSLTTHLAPSSSPLAFDSIEHQANSQGGGLGDGSYLRDRVSTQTIEPPIVAIVPFRKEISTQDPTAFQSRGPFVEQEAAVPTRDSTPSSSLNVVQREKEFVSVTPVSTVPPRQAPAFSNAPPNNTAFVSQPDVVVVPTPVVSRPKTPEAFAAMEPRERVLTKPNVIEQANIPEDERTPHTPEPEETLLEKLSAYLPKPTLSELNLTAAPPPTTFPPPHEQSDIDRLHPKEALPAVRPDVVTPVNAEERDRELEKVKAAKRELEGHSPQGTVVMGLEDDQLWSMLRRFDRQVNHALSPPHHLPEGQPDMRRSVLPTVPYNSDLVKSNLERCYGTAGVSGIRFFREMARLMSWAPGEQKRTGAFCAAYFTAWIFHQTTPLILLLLMTLVLYPPSRAYLFPPLPPPSGQPLSATDPTNRRGDESLVDVSHPQKHRSKHEQIEQQSLEFTKSIEKLGIRVLLGSKHKPSQAQMDQAEKMKKEGNAEGDMYGIGDEDGENENDSNKSGQVQNGKGNGESERNRVLKAGGTLKESNQKEGEKAKGERDAQIGLAAKAFQDALGDFADVMEMFTIALSPLKVYPPNHARFKIAFLILFPALIITAVVPSRIFAHAGSFALGFGFFGQPLVKRGISTFVSLVPDWKEELDLRNSILSGVPTNVQLTMYLLRQRELARNPLPRPPHPVTSPEAQKQLNDTSLISEAHEENSVSSVGSGTETHLVGDGKHDENQSERGKKMKSKVVEVGQKISAKAALFRGHGKVAVLPDGEIPGSKSSDEEKKSLRTRLSKFLVDRDTLKDEGSIWAYPASYNKTNGHLIIESTDETPTTDATIIFVPNRSQKPTVTFPIADVAEIKKGGVGLPRSILGWAAGMDLGGTGLEFRVKKHEAIYQGKEIAPGVYVDNVYFEDEAESEMDGEVYQFEKVGRRDQIFIRILSLAEQNWETL
ncbi:Protein of unknown function DUF3292 [Phaffia rhodozyma]|uniref:Uncharacterized protein n=1 Tax=Phaffia rhodozyma TaxID=264483 RepID=A0A0F7SY86_PHARH|nr:Protein of unknown function DUF3292 [Phaffia rhodozyma]